MHPEFDHMGDPFVRAVEETAELNLAIAKAHRFGLFNHHESQRYSNFDQLRFEMQDVRRALDRLDEHLAMLARIRHAGRNPPDEDTRVRFFEKRSVGDSAAPARPTDCGATREDR